MQMLTYLRQLKEQFPLDNTYDYPIPPECPIEIPDHCNGDYARNVYLKEHLAPALESELENATTLDFHYWIIRKWGKIHKFAQGRDRIIAFKHELNNGMLGSKTFNTISSFSKLSSFWDPSRYAIYDSMAVYALNWLIFSKHCKDKHLFPQPPGRPQPQEPSAPYRGLAPGFRPDARTLFELSRKQICYYGRKTAYHKYCERLRSLSQEVYDDPRPFHVEMLLFTVARQGEIARDIERTTTVSIR